MNQSWGGTIIDTNSDDDDVSELEDDNIISKELYIAKFCEIKQNPDTRALGLVNADVNRLWLVQDKCEGQYLEEEEVVGGDICNQVPWMQMAGMAPQASDAAIPHDLVPRLDPDVDWVVNRATPFELIEKAKDDMN